MPTDFQFIGINEVLTAFENRGADFWAIFAGSRMIMRGEGLDELKNTLNTFARSQTMAVYTLKVYDDIRDKADIKSKTLDDGSFNFKLFSMNGEGQLSGIVKTHYGDPTQAEILQRLAALENGDDEDDGEPGLIDQIGQAFIGMLQEPRKLHEFIGALTGQQMGPGTVGNVFRPGAEISNPALTADLSSEQTLMRIGAAVERLGAVDRDLVDHLEKLADIAEKTPARFKTLLTLLDAGL